MRTKIRLLPDDLINKIAAGEVIENPSSVVKELVENSLDAGAYDITVEIRGGGRQLVRITDNGIGMNPDDALLALERHATSKVTDFEDFMTLSTMGFRGEAIPSIASISKFSILSNQENVLEKATLVVVDGGKLIKQLPAVREKGTTIEVKELFFNVPVRKKFQRSPAYDSGEIYKTLSLIALANPHAKFKLIRDGETILSTPALNTEKPFIEALKERAEATLSFEWTKGLLPLESEESGFSICGWIGSPSMTRPNKQGQYLFINKRPVQSPIVSKAVKEGYGTLLAPNRYPVFILHLKVPAEFVDVNVHPQKKEVRLRLAEELSISLKEAVSSALTPKRTALKFAPVNFTVSEPMLQLKEYAPVEFELPEPITESWQMEIPEVKEEKLRYRIIATLPGYILAMPIGENKLLLFSQRRAHTRILFEEWTHNDKITSERLAFPVTIELSSTEVQTLENYSKEISSLGITIDLAGPNTALIEEVPSSFSKSALVPMMKNILAAFAESGKAALDQKRSKRALELSARAAISSSITLSAFEAEDLLIRLAQVENPECSPKGEPISKELTAEDLGKLL